MKTAVRCRRWWPAALAVAAVQLVAASSASAVYYDQQAYGSWSNASVSITTPGLLNGEPQTYQGRIDAQGVPSPCGGTFEVSYSGPISATFSPAGDSVSFDVAPLVSLPPNPGAFCWWNYYVDWPVQISGTLSAPDGTPSVAGVPYPYVSGTHVKTTHNDCPGKSVMTVQANGAAPATYANGCAAIYQEIGPA